MEMKAPEKIFLQIGNDMPGIEITWCDHLVNETDVPYVLESEISRLKEENQSMKNLINSVYQTVTNTVELNMSNYTEDEVESLNNGMMDIFTEIHNWQPKDKAVMNGKFEGVFLSFKMGYLSRDAEISRLKEEVEWLKKIMEEASNQLYRDIGGFGDINRAFKLLTNPDNWQPKDKS